MADIQSNKRNALTFMLFSIYLLALTWLILFKLQFSISVMREGRVLNLIPLLGSIDNGAVRFTEIINNILAFIPLGIYICMLKSKWPFVKKVLAITVLSLAYETAQFIFVIGRADITDVLSNTLGGVIGISVYVLASKLLKGKTNWVINIVALILTVIVVLFVTVLVVNHRWVRIQ